MKEQKNRTMLRSKVSDNLLEDLKAAKKKLKESEENLRKIQEVTKIGSYVLDLQTEAWTSTSMLNKILGISKNYNKNFKSWLRLVHPDQKKEMWNYFQREVLGKKKSFNKLYRMVRINDKKTRWLHGLGELEFDRSGTPIKMFGTIQDITERVLIEESLKNSEERFRILFEYAPDGYYLNDSKGRFIDGNRAAEKIIGYKREQLIGKNFLELKLLSTGQIPKAANLLFQNTRGKATGPDEFVLNRKDGTKAAVEIRTIPTKIKGKTVVLGIARDITERNKIDKIKNEFVSTASHQLRTPLAAVKWNVEALLARDAAELTGDQKRYLIAVVESNLQMIELVNSLLNISRIEMETFMVVPEALDIQHFTQAIVKEFAPEIREKNITLVQQYAPHLPAIIADPGLLRIIFQNLLSNAIKFTPSGGRIRLGIKWQSDRFLITVADSGYGILKKDQKKIFMKFFRSEFMIDKNIPGTGLGLYIVKEIVEYSKGAIWFESKRNKGSTFYVELTATGMARKKGTKRLDGSLDRYDKR